MSEWISPAASGALAPAMNGPRARFFGADCEERQQVQKIVPRPDDPREARFLQPQRAEEVRAVPPAASSRSRPSIAAETNHSICAFRLGLFKHARGKGVAFRRCFLVHVCTHRALAWR